MRYLTYLILTAFVICSTSCDTDESQDDLQVNSGLVGTWNAVKTSGGIAGFSCDYQEGELVFTFDSEDNLTIINNILNTSAICGGQEIGISVEDHKYGVLDSNDKKYLLVDDNELGEIVVSSNEFTLNQNNSSNGTGADGFFLSFAK